MAISRVGSAAAAATTITLPAGRIVGDLELMWVFRSASATAPTIPSDWFLVKNTSGNTCWGGLYYRRCTSPSDTSGTFTNASHLICVVYRGVMGIGASAVSNATGTSIAMPAITVIQSAGNSWIVGCEGHRTASNLNSAAITNMTNVTSVGTGPQAAIWDTNAGKSSWTLVNQTVNASSGHQSITAELLADKSTWNPYRTGSGFTLGSANLALSGGVNAAVNNSAVSLGHTQGKWVFLMTLTASADTDLGLCFGAFDQATSGANPDAVAGGCNWGGFSGNVHVGPTGTPDIGNAGTYTGSGGAVNAALFCAIDIDNKLIWFRQGTGGNWNNDASANPDTGAGGFAYSGMAGTVYPSATQDELDTGVMTWDGAATGHGLTRFAPWDSLNPISSPGVGALALGTFAATISIGGGGVSLTVPVRAVTIARAAARLGLGITPAARAVAITGQTPTIRQGTIRAPGAGALVVGRFAATLGRGLNPGVKAVVIAGQSARLGRGLSTPAGALALAGLAATVGRGYSPATRALAIGGLSARMDRGLKASAGSLALSGKVASIVQGASRSAPAAALLLACYSARLSLGVSPAPRALALAGLSATIDRGLRPGAAALAFASFAATIRISFVVSPGTAALTLSGRAGRLDRGLLPGPRALVLATYAASISTASGNISITVPVRALALGMLAARLSRGLTVPAASLAISGKASSMGLGVVPGASALLILGRAARMGLGVTPPARALSLATFAASISAANNHNITVPTVTLALLGRAASLGLRLSAVGTASLSLSGKAGSLGKGLQPGPASLALSGRAGRTDLAIRPPARAIALTGYAAGIGKVLSPAPATLTLASSSARLGLGVSVPVRAISLATFAATLDKPLEITVPVAALIIATYVPGLVLTTTSIVDTPELLGAEGATPLDGVDVTPGLVGQEDVTDISGTISAVHLEGEM